jgi:molybdopterin synthase catalytic subunit
MLTLTHNPIEPAALLQTVMQRDCGGVVLFLGTVRDLTDGRVTTALEYEAYAGMAEKELGDIAEQARERWPIGAVAVAHRLGKLDIMDIAVGVAVSCPHRSDAFEAARYIIDEVKKRAPIWKRDHTPDGTAVWVHPGA